MSYTRLIALLPVALLLLLVVFFTTANASKSCHQEKLFKHNAITEKTISADSSSEDTLYVSEFVLASDIIEREPVDIVQSYSMSDNRAWCFARIHNTSEMQDVFFRWYHENELFFEMNSKIGVSPHWRTYSSIGLQPGSWRVQLVDRDGNLLEEIQFRVSDQ